MKIFQKIKIMLLAGFFGMATPAFAEDIDIYTGASGGAAGAPKIMIVLDNSTDDLFSAKLDAISQVLNTVSANEPLEVGLTLWSQGSSPRGGYIRFAPQDMSVAANKTALQNMLATIKTNNESTGVKDEPEVFYEISKFFNGLAPYAGKPGSNPKADPKAFKGDGTYSSVSMACSNSYIIYIAANNGFSPQDVQGQQKYETISAGPALPPTSLANYWGDEWTHYNYGQSAQITTYVLDAASPGNSDAFYSTILQAEAKQGGGTWQYVSSQTAIFAALQKIFIEVKSVNSTFASASLPVSTTNRTQNGNQVFIGMFRPDPRAAPRWMGNMKQYQLIKSGTSVDLGDTNGNLAVNPLTGFLTACATSFWTTDSGTYWQNVPENPSPAGSCPPVVTPFDRFSDAPDGPIVEKGSVAEVIRKGNNPPTTNTAPTWAVNRNVYTQSGNLIVPFSTTSSGLSAAVVDYTLGKDTGDENGNSNLTEVRASVHGDVVHSRPLPINYGTTKGVTVFYGANDATLRAVDAATGAERWAFIAPEFFSRLQRMKDNSPIISYAGLPTTNITPTPTPKDYFFDGAIGVYQNADNSKVWIYPTMRRGGRTIYALDVTNPVKPSLKWKVGCPNLTNDTGCVSGFAGMGQTWSAPAAALVKGYSGSVPVLVVGGGNDACEDANAVNPACNSAKGAGVYILNGDTGAILAYFPTLRSVVADVALIDTDGDGMVDYAYASDMGGNIYRIDFVNGADTKTPLTADKWTMKRVAYTNGNGRKFLFAPALLQAGNKVYLAIGSGDREHPLQSHYPYSTPILNRFYVYLDDLNASVANDLDNTTTMLDNTLTNSCNAATSLPGGSSKGWFVSLNQNGTGEQVVTSAVIASGMISFSTNRPIPPAAASCSTNLGEARGYWLNLINGSGTIGIPGLCGGNRSAIFAGGGLPPSPVVGTVTINGRPVTVVIGAAQRAGGASSPIASQQVRPAINGKRKTIYWKSTGQH